MPLLWVGGDELPTLKVNQFLVQVDPDGDVFLTLGTLTPPVLLADDPDDLRKQAAAIGYVPIRTVIKLALSAKGLRDLVGILHTGIEILEAQETAE